MRWRKLAEAVQLIFGQHGFHFVHGGGHCLLTFAAFGHHFLAQFRCQLAVAVLHRLAHFHPSGAIVGIALSGGDDLAHFGHLGVVEANLDLHMLEESVHPGATIPAAAATASITAIGPIPTAALSTFTSFAVLGCRGRGQDDQSDHRDSNLAHLRAPC